MVKAGFVDFDTSHTLQFTKRFNHVEIDEDQWVDGVRLVAGLPGTPAPGNEKRTAEYIETCKGWGLKIVDSPEALMKEVDVVLVESLEGSRHLERARPFIEAGLSMFIDKPFTDSIREAEILIELADKHGAKLMTGSSLRYAIEVQELHADVVHTGQVLGAVAYSPSTPLNDVPALVNYGVHGVETLYGIMHRGCQRVSSVDAHTLQSVTGFWEGGRTGVMIGVQKAKGGYGFTAYCENAIVRREIDASYIYRELLKKMSAFFNTGEPPIPIEESLEVMVFIEKALESAKNNGAAVAM